MFSFSKTNECSFNFTFQFAPFTLVPYWFRFRHCFQMIIVPFSSTRVCFVLCDSTLLLDGLRAALAPALSSLRLSTIVRSLGSGMFLRRPAAFPFKYRAQLGLRYFLGYRAQLGLRYASSLSRSRAASAPVASRPVPRSWS